MGNLNFALSQGLNAAAQVLQTEMKRQFVVRSSPGFGTKIPPELGRKGKGPGGYVSAPFAAPTYQSGGTSRSIQVLRTARPSSLSAQVGTKNPVGYWLEHGTLPRANARALFSRAGTASQAVHSGMAPRPWLSIAMTFAVPKMRVALIRAAQLGQYGIENAA